VLNATLFCYALLGYYYMFYSMIDKVVVEFKSSRWVDVLEKLIRIRDEEESYYYVSFLFVCLLLVVLVVINSCSRSQSRFPRSSIWYISTTKELRLQFKHYTQACVWLGRVLIAFVKGVFKVLSPYNSCCL
jgi:hypothetical protein